MEIIFGTAAVLSTLGALVLGFLLSSESKARVKAEAKVSQLFEANEVNERTAARLYELVRKKNKRIDELEKKLSPGDRFDELFGVRREVPPTD